jgi:hypothetical protein
MHPEEYNFNLSVIDYKTGDYNFIITLGVLKIADK